ALDDFLDLVLTTRAEGALRNFFQNIVTANGFDDFLFAFFAIVIIIAIDVVGVRVALVGFAKRNDVSDRVFVMVSIAVFSMDMLILRMIIVRRRLLMIIRGSDVVSPRVCGLSAGACYDRDIVIRGSLRFGWCARIGLLLGDMLHTTAVVRFLIVM